MDKLEELRLEELQNFEILENDEQEASAEKRNSKVACWVGTWNNPSMSDDEFEKFFIELYNSNLLQYAIFQREKGLESGIIHFQFFVNFKNARYFTWVKKTLPYGCHFKPMRSTKSKCRSYCSKPDTRVNDPREIGEFIEERARTDLARALKMQEEGIPLEEIEEMFPQQVFMYRNQFKNRQIDLTKQKFGKIARNVQVYYIYGPPRCGKTSYVLKKYGLENVFVIDNYGEYQFTGYESEKVVLFDEFAGQVRPITKMNKLLEPYPLKLNIKGGITYACFDKVYIISNNSLESIYKDDKVNNYAQYNAFLQRINFIYRFDAEGNIFCEKRTVYEDIPENEICIKGLTKCASEIYSTSYGIESLIYSKHKKVPDFVKVHDDLPFDNEDKQAVFDDKGNLKF